MKALNIPAGYVVNNFLRKKILQNVYGQYMKESNILAAIAASTLLKRAMLFYTKGQ